MIKEYCTSCKEDRIMITEGPQAGTKYIEVIEGNELCEILLDEEQVKRIAEYLIK